MLNLSLQELVLLKGSGGERFTRFVDGLIRAEAYAGGLPQAEIDTQLRVNIADGGVDTHVRKAVPKDKCGYLNEPTFWQYKSETYSELMAHGGAALSFLTAEIQKTEARRLIECGCAFRFCFLGDITPAHLEDWESYLLTECRRISPTTAIPRVVAADKLIAWAERFPAIASFIRPQSRDELYSLDVLQLKVRSVTPQYVRFDGWAFHEQTITEHVTAVQPNEACLWIQGEAGVGKTRLVVECVARLMESASLVVYTADEQRAESLSAQLANNNAQPYAVVIADECSLSQRLKIEDNLAGCRDRVRFICLSNSGERGISGASEIWLEEMPRQVVDQILQKNFPLVPVERRNAYAELSGGFIRLSADMCANHDRLNIDGDFGVILSKVTDYVKHRLPGKPEQAVLNLLALFTKVGVRSDVAFQLNNLCNITGMVPEEVKEIAKRIKDSPGFINFAGRFVYVTPAIVARIAFVRGWERWIKDDLGAFVDKLDKTLLGPFLNRVRDIAPEEVKADVAAAFRDWISTRRYENLTDKEQADRISTLVETDAERYLPLLRNLILDAPDEMIREGSQFGSSPRRQIVWLCERLAAFPNLYRDCESILFRLAVLESEKKIGNNATGIWCQMQRIILSGSSVPFEERFQRLQSRVHESIGPVFDLCMKAISGIFNTHVSRMGAPATVGGRLRPEDWRPGNNHEFRECWAKVLELLRLLITGSDAIKSAIAKEVLIENLNSVLESGFAKEARSILTADQQDSVFFPTIIERIEDYLARKARETIATQPLTNNDDFLDYLSAVKSWLLAISPTSFSGKLRTLVSRSQWHKSLRATNGYLNRTLVDLASEAVHDPALLESELEFLMSNTAQSAALFGHAMGQADTQHKLLSTIFGALKIDCNLSLARGYVFGVLQNHDTVPQALEDWLTTVATFDPKAAIELRFVGGEKLQAFRKAIEAVDKGELLPQVLVTFVFSRQFSQADIKDVLRRIVVVDKCGSNNLREPLRFLTALWPNDDSTNAEPALQDPEICEFVWKILEATSDVESATDGYERTQLIEQIIEFDPPRCISMLFDSVVLRGYGDVHDYALRSLISLAPVFPREIMNVFGPALLDKEKNVALFGAGATALIEALPSNTVLEWVRQAGIDAAKIFARELPLPFVDKEGSAIVPQVTLCFLREFAGEKEVCENFGHPWVRSESWWGSGGDHFRAKAAIARRFLSHENRWIQTWAEMELNNSALQAETEQIHDEERMI